MCTRTPARVHAPTRTRPPSQVHKLDTESLRQQELVYNAEFQIQHMERRVARASGVRSDEEKKALQVKIDELSRELEERTSEHGMLQQQLKRQHEGLRAARRARDKLDAEKEKVGAAIAELRLQNSSAEAGLKKKGEEKGEQLVAHDVLKLQVRERSERSE